MSTKSNEIKAGILVLLSIIVLTIFIVAITGSKLWYQKDEYYVLMQFAGGLEPGVPVRYGGIKVGEVKEIKIFEEDNSKIKATLYVQKMILNVLSIHSGLWENIILKLLPAPIKVLYFHLIIS